MVNSGEEGGLSIRYDATGFRLVLFFFKALTANDNMAPLEEPFLSAAFLPLNLGPSVVAVPDAPSWPPDGAGSHILTPNASCTPLTR